MGRRQSIREPVIEPSSGAVQLNTMCPSEFTVAVRLVGGGKDAC